ncbi:MAG: hypothetical protein E7048_04745 [Lentisphaerae bacterium]|nr:hypothetical protein [Lentisphaerota bacterium]
MKQPLKIYFAGDLFDAKDLAGNLLFARAVEKFSDNRYKVMLPQDGECEVSLRSAKSIRDADFELLFECDLIVANFDGADLDSGTVVEFCFAKMVDMPTVLLRSDFRSGGDETLSDNVPWNLMCSNYPRTRVLHLNAMSLYHRARADSKESDSLLDLFYRSLALELIRELDTVTAEPAWLPEDELFSQYQRTVKSIGGTLPDRLPEEKLRRLAAAKTASGLF